MNNEFDESAECQCQDQQCDRCFFARVELEEMDDLQKLDF